MGYSNCQSITFVRGPSGSRNERPCQTACVSLLCVAPKLLAESWIMHRMPKQCIAHAVLTFSCCMNRYMNGNLLLIWHALNDNYQRNLSSPRGLLVNRYGLHSGKVLARSCSQQPLLCSSKEVNNGISHLYAATHTRANFISQQISSTAFRTCDRESRTAVELKGLSTTSDTR